jgi:16S rRNA (uracil1498-N3)-methyltransferase
MSDAALPRFFADSPLVAGALRLAGDEAHHLAHVLRLGTGDRVTLFDGAGHEAAAVIVAVGRHAVDLAAEAPRQVSRELGLTIRLAVSLPRGDRQKLLVEKLTELGVHQLVPLVTRRGVAQPGPEAIARLRRQVIAASKQCGRNLLMEIAEPQDIGQLTRLDGLEGGGWFADPDQSAAWMGGADLGDGGVVAIGPEGGFAPEELRAFAGAGWRGLRLGPAILRIETAALAVAAVWAARAAPLA